MKWAEIAAHIIDVAFCVNVIVWIATKKSREELSMLEDFRK